MCIRDRYLVEELPPLPNDTAASALGVNDSGLVVGASSVAFQRRFHAVLWHRGRVRALGTLGGNNSTAVAVTNGGAVIGNSDTASGRSHGYLWKRGRMRDLGSLGGDQSYARAANDREQVVGDSQTAAGEPHPFLWSRGHMTDLTTWGLVPYADTAEAVDDHGRVYGRRQMSPGVWHAVRWDRGSFLDLGPAHSWDASVRGVNHRGVAVGWQVPPGSTDPITHATVWRGVQSTDLGTAGGLFSDAYAVNDHGQVAGRSSVGAVMHPVTWAGGRLTVLPGLSASTVAGGAYDVNDAGVIAGALDDPDGRSHAVLWRPTRR